MKCSGFGIAFTGRRLRYLLDRRLVGQKPSLYFMNWYDEHAPRDWARPKSVHQTSTECCMMSGVKIVDNDQPSAALRMEYTRPRAAFPKDSA